MGETSVRNRGLVARLILAPLHHRRSGRERFHGRCEHLPATTCGDGCRWMRRLTSPCSVDGRAWRRGCILQVT